MERGGGTFLRARAKREYARRDAQDSIRRDDVHVVRLDPQVVRDLLEGQGCRALEDRREGAFVLRIEVLHKHETHAGIRGQLFEQLGERFEPAGRCADTNDGK